MSYKIVHDKASLHKPTEPVATIQEGDEIAQKLIAVLEGCPHGIGLSANQIGIPKSVSVVKIPDQDIIVLMNPTIVSGSSEKIIYNEGCLSLPGKIVQTVRHTKVTVSTLNHANELMFGPDIEPLTQESVGKDYGLLKSVCVQHEVDHLNGRLIVDDGIRFISPPKRAAVKHGRNDKVVIEKDGSTQYIKYKKALELITNDGWKLI